MAIKSQTEIQNDLIAELQSQDPNLTDTNEGSIIDVISGVVATAISEIQEVAINEFRKTFFDTANGPEVTGGSDDLQTLAVDHFGANFVRPAASKATGTVSFTRPNTDSGNCTILAGSIVKTPAGATGKSVRFETVSEVTMTGTSISASVRASIAGTDGNVLANKVTQIETSLTDSSIVVNNAGAFAGGQAAETDAQYRETIRRLIQQIKGATKEAVESAALTVDGVVEATAVEEELPVIAYDIGAGEILFDAEFFRIPYANLYIADANGTASQALIDDVTEAIQTVRAFGVYVKVKGATAIAMDWEATIVLNISGPNYAEFSSNPQDIIDAMTLYLNTLDIGDDFIIATAEAEIMAIYGPAGTDDLVSFTTVTPVGDVATDANEKIVAGTISIT